MKKGFTLIELLITLSIVATVLAIAIPVSYTTYKGYRESLEAQKVLMFFSSLRRESFLYNREKFIEAKNGSLKIDGAEKEFEGISIYIEKPIIFYKNGTTSGGKIRLKMENSAFLIYIDAPSGNLKFEREYG